MRLAVLKNPFHLRIHLPAVSLQRFANHANTAEGHDRPLQRRVCLQPDDTFILPVDIAGRMRGNRGNRLFINIQHPTGRTLLCHQIFDPVPYRQRLCRRRRQEALVTVIRRIVANNKIPRINFFVPISFIKRHLSPFPFSEPVRIACFQFCCGRLPVCESNEHHPESNCFQELTHTRIYTAKAEITSSIPGRTAERIVVKHPVAYKNLGKFRRRIPHHYPVDSGIDNHSFAHRAGISVRYQCAGFDFYAHQI